MTHRIIPAVGAVLFLSTIRLLSAATPLISGQSLASCPPLVDLKSYAPNPSAARLTGPMTFLEIDPLDPGQRCNCKYKYYLLLILPICQWGR
ncbi:hypothetical protein B0H11DRAFT_2108554 [Mycena galericulata]|nr:hypothetical protein B0H11DRAFT_2108554 [Mycena galericulata]